MKKLILLNILSLCIFSTINAQVYTADLSQDNGGSPGYWGPATTGYSAVFTNASNNTVTLTSFSARTDNYESMGYDLNEYNGSNQVNTTVNMSGAGDNIVYVVAKSSGTGIKLRVDAKDGNYVTNLNAARTANLTSSYAVYALTMDFQDGYSGGCSVGTPCTVDNTIISQLLLSINDGSALTSDAVVDIQQIQIGGTAPVILGTKSALNLTASKLYPNPTSEKAIVELSLNSVSDVKVTLTDMMGKQVDAIESTTADFAGSFNTSNLSKGIYTVNYFINNEPAKAELLMVK